MPEPLPHQLSRVQVQGTLDVKQVLGPCPRQGDSQTAHVAPEWHLGIWHKKDSSSQTALHFASKPHPIPAQPGHFPPSLETGNPTLTTQGRGPQERGSPTQGAEELEHTDTQRPRKHTHTKATCTHSYTNAQALPGARLRRRPGLRSGSPISWNPDSFLFGNIRGRGAPCPLASRQQVSIRAEGADPGHTGARSVWRYPSSLTARTLRHLQVNVQFLLFQCPHTHTGLLSGWSFSQYQWGQIPLSLERAGTEAKSALSEVPLFPFGDRSRD